MYLKYKREARNWCPCKFLTFLLVCFSAALVLILSWAQRMDSEIFLRSSQRKGFVLREANIGGQLLVSAKLQEETEFISALMNLTQKHKPTYTIHPTLVVRLNSGRSVRKFRPTPRSEKQRFSRKPRVTPRVYQDVIIITPKPQAPEDEKLIYSAKNNGITGHELLNAFFEQVIPDYMTGKLNVHVWERICGPHIEQLRQSPLFPRFPSHRRLATEFKSEFEGTDFGERIFGFIHPHSSGFYQFATSSDDTSELWLSTDSDPKNSRLIATVFSSKGIGFTKAGDFQKYPTQISRKIKLHVGRKYYIEALHKQGRGKSHLQVLWKNPLTGNKEYEKIPSKLFSMFTDDNELRAQEGGSLKDSDFELYAPKDIPSHVKRKLDPTLETFLYKC